MVRGWSSDIKTRALARTISCEMHAGFTNIRTAMPMNIKGKRQIDYSDALIADLKTHRSNLE